MLFRLVTVRLHPPNQEMYHEGEGTKISKRRAGRWFLKAAEQGRREAQYNVAMMYHFGIPIAEKGNMGNEWRISEVRREKKHGFSI